MAIPAVSATPFSLATPAEVMQVRDVFVRETESSLFVSSPAFPFADTVDLSDTSRLLSSTAALAETANTAARGDSVDPESVIEDAQRFVDSVNALSLSAPLLEPDGAQDLAFDPATSASPPEAPGIDIVPVGADTFLLTLDAEVLEGALQANPAATVTQLADFALPVGTQLAAQSLQAGLPADRSSINGNAALGALAVSGQTDVAVLAAAEAQPVVPDLTVVNAELRRALADTALMDTLAETLPAAPELAIPPLLVPAVPEAERDRLGVLMTPLQDLPEGPEEARSPLPPMVPSPAASSTATQLAQAEASQLLPAAELPQAVLTPDELLSTPLEQISRLAANPMLAGAVAAFQIVGDEGGRNPRVTLQSDFDVVNPMEAVLQTEAVGPNLANTTGQRRDDAGDNRRNAWLATRPRLI